MTELPEKKTSLLDKSRDLLSSTLSSLKGQDLQKLVEEFTAEATTVIEGLSEDQLRLRRENAQLQTQQTLLEEEETRRHHDLSRKVDEQFEQLSARLDGLNDRLQSLEKQTREKRARNAAGLTGALRQATYLAGILAGAWIVTTILKFFQ